MLNTSESVVEENTTHYNNTGFVHSLKVDEIILYSSTVLCSLFGLVGNGKIIWVLSLCREKNPYTTYILNLAVADSGTLLTLSTRSIIMFIPWEYDFDTELLDSLTYFTYNASVYFLTIISLEKCLSVLFPIWYRCHRPERSSAMVSFLLWVISSLLSGTLFFSGHLTMEGYLRLLNAIFTINLLIFAPIMVASTLIMSVKLCRSTWRHQPPRLYIAILVTLLFFVVFAIPLSVSYFILLNTGLISFPAFESSFLFASFNSSINPVIYYFVGRNRKKCRESLKVVFKRVFRDEAIPPDGT